MSLSQAAPLRPSDRAAIRLHLDVLFRRADAIEPGCLAEIAWEAGGALNRAMLFPTTPAGLDAAGEFAAGLNDRGHNVYVGVNPRKAGTPREKRTSGADVAFALFHFLDGDTEAAATAHLFYEGPITYSVLTGSAPFDRRHLYWELERPELDLSAWRARQDALVPLMAGDPNARNADRVLRLAGTWAYPGPRKIERGYRVELVTAAYKPMRVTVPDLFRTFDAVPPTISAAPPPAEAGRKPIGDPSLRARDPEDLAGIVRAMPNEFDRERWVELAHSMKAGFGGDEDFYEAFEEWCLKYPGSTEESARALWDSISDSGIGADFVYREAERLGVRGAVAATNDFGTIPEDPDEIDVPVVTPDRPKLTVFAFDSIYRDKTPDAPDLIGPHLLAEGEFLLIAGPPKSMKSLLLQDILVSAALGRDVLGFSVARPMRVFWLQAEMTYKLLRKRAKAEEFDPDDLRHLGENMKVSDRFTMVLDAEGERLVAETILDAFGGDAPDIVAFDPLANLFDGDSENDNAEMMRFLQRRLEGIRRRLGGRVAFILVHHSSKAGNLDLSKDPFNAIRGAGALRGYYTAAIVIHQPDPQVPERRVFFDMRSDSPPEPKTVTYRAGRMVCIEAPLDDFQPEEEIPSHGGDGRARSAELALLAALDTLRDLGVSVSERGASAAPREVIQRRLVPGFTADEMRDAMFRLQQRGDIVRAEIGKDTRRRPRFSLVRAQL